MELLAESVIHHPVGAAYRAYRDHLPELVNDVESIDRIEVLDRKGVRGGVKLHNLWVAQAPIPRMARSVITPELMCWDDYAHWRNMQQGCQWELAARANPERFGCVGRHEFLDTGDGHTHIRITGDLRLSLQSVPGLPRRIAAPLEEKVAAWIVSMMVDNLVRINEELEAWLDARDDPA